MANMINTGTRDISLKLAEKLSQIVNNEWESGEFVRKVTPITADLLHYWFNEVFVQERTKNFHEGQRQAILNTIYCHEVLKCENLLDIYASISQSISENIADDRFLGELAKVKHAHPKYCVKMATGTGKTWVLNALLIWQYLNANIAQDNSIVKYTKNFLLVAPGLIVYERLLDAFKGKQNEYGQRDFATSDLKGNEELFVPEKYRNTLYSFVQNSVAEKSEIGRKTTNGGMIAITNWHLLIADEEVSEDSAISMNGFSFDSTKELAQDFLPISPGKTYGHSLDVLDSKYFKGGELDFLAKLPNICVFNDEAHHIHENKTAGITSEVEWQKSLNEISQNKGRSFIQIDFSATPYDVTGSGGNRTKHYFPHIVVDFDLTRAMRQGLVKSFVLDRRKEICDIGELNFKAERDGRDVKALSAGQRVMLRAGLTKLKMLEKHFVALKKYPKMLVVCEDTKVSPLVVDFLREEGLSDEDIMRVDSNQKGDISEKEWDSLKQKLFSLDSHEKPKVVISVLMLREGFDVSNVCVIVPLRSSEAPILLEQVLGRGLRLMWREPEYADIKKENRQNLYELKKDPKSMQDILYVVEHPAYEKFYEDLDQSLIVADKRENVTKGDIVGDMIEVGLKENYHDYDMFFPLIRQDREETIKNDELLIDNIKPFDETFYPLEKLKKLVPKSHVFISHEPVVKTRFGEYAVTRDIFNAKSYNEYLQKMVLTISTNLQKTHQRGKQFPLLQINQAILMKGLDKFICTKLFKEPFEPLLDDNWRVLMITSAKITEHIVRELCSVIYKMQTEINISEAIVEKRYFSEVSSMKIREEYSLDIVKSIYQKTGYPSNRGGLEKDFLLFCDNDSKVERIVKISEYCHTFARFHYTRSDGMIASYSPDFMLKIADKIYIVETKAQKDIEMQNVKAKQYAALEMIKNINELKPEERMSAKWAYVLIDDTTFYAKQKEGATAKDILQWCSLTNAIVEERLELW